MDDKYIKAMQEQLLKIARKRQRLKGEERAILYSLEWYRNLKRQGLLTNDVTT